MLKNLFQPSALPTDADGPIRVIVAAPPNVAQPFLTLGPGHTSGVYIVSTTRDAADLASDIGEYKPHIVLLSPDVRGYETQLVAQVANWPDGPVAIVGVVAPTGTWGSEMAACGAVGFFHTPVTQSIVEQFARQAREFVDESRRRWSAPIAASGVPRPVVEAVGATSYRTGAVAFWSTKGGDGKTTLAANVACLLAFVAGKRVLLIDADMNCGRIALHLNIPPRQNTLVHLASDYKSAGDRLDGAMLRRRVVSADRELDPRTKSVESRLDVIFGITRIEQASSEELHGQYGERFMDDLLRLGRELYDFVIVDLGSSTQMGPHFGALRAADLVIFVNTSDRTSLYHNRETFQALVRDADLRGDKFRLVVNRYDPADRIELSAVAEFMGMTVFVTVPEDRTRSVVASVNEGRPFVLGHMGKNPPEVEATLRGMLEISEGIFPPIGKIIAARNGKQKKGLLSIRRGGGRR